MSLAETEEERIRRRTSKSAIKYLWKKIHSGFASKFAFKTPGDDGKTFNLVKAPVKENYDEDLEVIRGANLPIIWIMGGPGAPIQSLFSRIARVYSFHHIYVGEILKQEIVLGTGRSDMVNRLMHRGIVLPRQFLNEIIKRDMAEAIKNNKCNGFIFTDYPNNFPQAKVFLNKIQKVDFVIVLKFDDKTMKLCAFHTLRRQSLSSKSLRKSKDELRRSAEEEVNKYNKNLTKLYKFYGNKIKVVDGQLEITGAYNEVMKWIERAMVIHNRMPPFLPDPPVKPRLFGSCGSASSGGSGSLDLESSSDVSLYSISS